jgi:hypothetical protein
MLDMKLHATLSSIGLMYLGDHSMKMPLPLPVFKSLAWVYHQMWRQDLKQEHAYLLAPLPPPVSVSADATIYVPSTHILLYMCPHTILLYVSTYHPPVSGGDPVLQEAKEGAGGDADDAGGGVEEAGKVYWVPLGPRHTWRPFQVNLN